MGQIKVLNNRGDQTIEWDPADAESVSKAEGAFNALKKEGYEFYEAETKTVVKTFKKTLGTLIAAPGVTGTGGRGLRGGPPHMSA